MPRARDPIGPLLDLNHGRIPLDRLNRLSARITAAGLPLTVLTERSVVDAHGTVTREMDLCAHCRGTCCQELQVPITHADARRLAKHLGVTVRRLPLREAPEELDEVERDAQPNYAGYLTHGDGPCPFFHGRCTVHEARPEVCRNYGLHACALESTFHPVQIRVRKRGSPRAKK